MSIAHENLFKGLDYKNVLQSQLISAHDMMTMISLLTFHVSELICTGNQILIFLIESSNMTTK